jgi:hypothetical protein
MRTCYTFAGAAILALSAQAFAAPLPPQPKAPKGPGPQFLIVASADIARGTITTEHTVQTLVPVQTTRVVERDGRKVQETITVYRTVYRTEHRAQSLAGLKAFTAAGKPLSGQELGKRLEAGTVVLLSSSGAMPEEAYLKLVKPDTLVLVSEAPVAVPDTSVPAVPPNPVIPRPKPLPSVPKPQ